MGLFSFFRAGADRARFVTKNAFTRNLANQIQSAFAVIEQLGAGDKELELELEYFFYTNSADKAQQLSTALIELGYTCAYKKSAWDEKQFVVTGWTTKLNVSEQAMSQWITHMCDLGYQSDCEFDGWGTDRI